MSFATGWIPNPEALAQYRATLPESGHAPMSALAPDGEPLEGYWKRLKARGVTSVLLQDAEPELFGKWLPAQMQYRGTCVSQSMKRAVQDTLYNAIVFKGQIAKPVQFCFETIYAGARVDIGKGSLGRAIDNEKNDGAYGWQAAQCVHNLGNLPRGIYQGQKGPIDLSKDQEMWAVAWADPGNGVPKALLPIMAQYLVDACYFPRSKDSICDCLAARYAGQRCAQLLYGKPDRNGECHQNGDGGHAEELCGVYVDENGVDKLVEQNSWGSEPGECTIRTAGGPIKLRQGSYGVDAQFTWDHVSRGNGNEAWFVGGVGAPRPEAAA